MMGSFFLFIQSFFSKTKIDENALYHQIIRENNDKGIKTTAVPPQLPPPPVYKKLDTESISTPRSYAFFSYVSSGMDVISSFFRTLFSLFSFHKRIKTPAILQMEATECGSVCLSIILSHYGHELMPEEARSSCGVSRDGSKASYILKAARQFHMDAAGYSIQDPKDLEELPYPSILHWNFDHFVVFEGKKGRHYCINDPAHGHRFVDENEFNQSFTGIVLTLTPTKDFIKKRQQSALSLFFTYALEGSIFALFAAVIIGILQIIPGVIMAGSAKVFVDHILMKAMSHWLPPLISIIIITTFFSMIFMLLHQRLLARMHLHFQLNLTSKIIHRLFYLPLTFFDQRFSGDILFRISSVQRLCDLLSLEIMEAFTSLISAIFFCWLLYIMSPTLLLTIVLFIIARFLTFFIFRNSIRDNTITFTQSSGRLAGIEMNGVGSIETLKANNLESAFFKNWAATHDETLNKFGEVSLVDQRKNVCIGLLTGLMGLFVLYQGAIDVTHGVMTVGTLIAFISLSHYLDQPLMTLLEFTTNLEKIKASINRFHDILYYGHNNDHNHLSFSSTSSSFLPHLKNHIQFHNVTFGYAPLDPPIFKHLNLVIPKGKITALVGLSGSGKSTISKMLCGLYPPLDGKILWDQTPLDTIDSSIRSKLIALVDQDIFLFEGTVRDNLTSWNHDISDETLMEALHHVGLYDDFVGRGLLNAPLSENGLNLSGGQRQRLDIARALSSKPDLLILDEATSALDALSEEQIYQSLKNTSATLLIIAHRLSTLHHADLIYTIDDGKIAQCGNAHDLMKEDGLFRHLVMMEENA